MYKIEFVGCAAHVIDVQAKKPRRSHGHFRKANVGRPYSRVRSIHAHMHLPVTQNNCLKNHLHRL